MENQGDFLSGPETSMKKHCKLEHGNDVTTRDDLNYNCTYPVQFGRSSIRAPAHLRSGDDHCPIDVCRGQVLNNREVLIRRPRRGVHNEVVHLSPVHVAEELLDHACEEESTVMPAVFSLRRTWDSTEAQCLSFPYIWSVCKSGAFGNT